MCRWENRLWIWTSWGKLRRRSGFLSYNSRRARLDARPRYPSSLICEHARVKWRHISCRFHQVPDLWRAGTVGWVAGWGGESAFLVTVVTFTWARLFRSCYFHHVGITAQLKCVLSAVRHRGCSPRCSAPRSAEGDVSDSASAEPARRA